jgi:hypothetical protein
MDNLIIVAILNAHLPERRPGDDFKIALDRDAERIEAETAHHLGHARTARDTPVFTVDAD